jgi:hypothetical protein
MGGSPLYVLHAGARDLLLPALASHLPSQGTKEFQSVDWLKEISMHYSANSRDQLDSAGTSRSIVSHGTKVSADYADSRRLKTKGREILATLKNNLRQSV